MEYKTVFYMDAVCIIKIAKNNAISDKFKISFLNK
jgi:hypothetical protein